MRYLRNVVPWPYPADGARHFCEENALPQMKRSEGWYWTLRLKSEPKQIIGCINLRKGEQDHRGFWLGREWQEQGLMSEACAWVNDFWFEVLRVSKAADNRASSRISEKQGMRLVGHGEKDYVCGRLPSEMWEITVEEWRAWKASHFEHRTAP